MESYQPFSPSFNSSTLMAETQKPKRPEPITPTSESKTAQTGPKTPEGCIGVLDVFIHEARDIHNICIYHKQDVYAKLCLTTDPEPAVSTQIINGGGQNPVFNQSLRLNVKTIDASLKCEVWMLSRVKNYLEDQLLGFALVPLSDVVVANGKLVQEFSLSSTDLFHSPAGFVQLSISYTGSSPEVMAITPHRKEAPVSENDSYELEKIEFPDLKVANENKMMVSEYYGIPCDNLDAQCAEELLSAGSDNCPDNEAGVRVVESLAAANSPESVGIPKNDTPVSSISTNESPNEKERSTDVEAESSVGTTDNAPALPVFSINIEPDQSVVQQDIVDMYMKSMQQFTESLANMKLPMDFETRNNDTTTSSSSSSNGRSSIENGSPASAKKLPEAKKAGSRVFYGSSAFF